MLNRAMFFIAIQKFSKNQIWILTIDIILEIAWWGTEYVFLEPGIAWNIIQSFRNSFMISLEWEVKIPLASNRLHDIDHVGKWYISSKNEISYFW